jgi:hypothetical protein
LTLSWNDSNRSQVIAVSNVSLMMPRSMVRSRGIMAQTPQGAAAVILSPRGFLCEAEQIGAGNVVVVTGFSSAESVEE